VVALSCVAAGAGAQEAAPTERKVLQVTPTGPPHVFVLHPSPRLSNGPGRHRAGTIEVNREGRRRPPQVIEVYTHANGGIDSFSTLDVNFDGYLDLRVMDDFGGKWQSYRYWVFDPARGRFVKDALARDLEQLTSAQMEVDAKARRIHLQNFHGHCFPVRRDYVVRGGRLRLIEEWRLDPDRPECPETHRRYAADLAPRP
jgi:hypothetical protein